MMRSMIMILVLLVWCSGCTLEEELLVVTLDDATPTSIPRIPDARSLALHVDREARWIVAQSVARAQCEASHQVRVRGTPTRNPLESGGLVPVSTSSPTPGIPNNSKRKIDPNTATFHQLQRLPRVGKATARAIIDGRPYGRIEDLTKVRGIGSKTLENLRPMIQIGP